MQTRLNLSALPLTKTPVWFITGASSGFGAAVARAALQRGYRVAATARDTSSLHDLGDHHPDQLLALHLDLRDTGSISAAVARAKAHFGHLDVVILARARPGVPNDLSTTPESR